MAFEKKWLDYIVLGDNNKDLVVQLHKDEYCTFDPTDIPNTILTYHSYWDTKLMEKGILWSPLGVRKVFPRIFPHEIKPAKER